MIPDFQDVPLHDLCKVAFGLARARARLMVRSVVAPHWRVVCSVVPEFFAFDGAQVWTVSASRGKSVGGRLLERDSWSAGDLRRADQLIDLALGERGDPKCERSFSTISALYRCRALDASELDSGLWKQTQDLFIPLSPLVVHWSRGLPERVSALPCKRPRVESAPSGAMRLAFDCEVCEPCRARAEVRAAVSPSKPEVS